MTAQTIVQEKLGAAFMDRIEFMENGCWEWRGSTNGWGYGSFSIRGKNYRAHRLTYEAVNGPIPAPLQIDHLCRNTICVNPSHLEAVTSRENTMRSNAPTAINARKTRCVRGHLFTDEDTYTRIRNGRVTRLCRACDRDHKRALRKKAGAPRRRFLVQPLEEGWAIRDSRDRNKHVALFPRRAAARQHAKVLNEQEETRLDGIANKDKTT